MTSIMHASPSGVADANTCAPTRSTMAPCTTSAGRASGLRRGCVVAPCPPPSTRGSGGWHPGDSLGRRARMETASEPGSHFSRPQGAQVQTRTERFAAHVAEISRDTEAALAQARRAGAEFDGIVFHAGTQVYYHADDSTVYFKPTPHFARFAPVTGPDHLLLFRAGSRPKLAHVVPRDYWYEAPAAPDHPYAQVLDVVQVDSAEAAQRALGDVRRCAYIGSDPAVAVALGIDPRAIEPAALVAPLDWARATKTEYEIDCIREAGRIAARGHSAVR